MNMVPLILPERQERKRPIVPLGLTWLSCVGRKAFLLGILCQRGDAMPILIRGARLLDPANQVDIFADILIEGAHVAAIGYNLSTDCCGTGTTIEFESGTIIEASGRVLVPGLVDIHVHLREPGREHKETILTGCRAAAAGGYTAVCAMPNTLPTIDSVATLAYFKEKAACAPVRCYPIAAVTLRQQGRALTDAVALRAAGAVAFSDDGEPVSDALLFARALKHSHVHQAPLIAHCEDKELARGGVMHHGSRSATLSLPGIPARAEEEMVKRDLQLAAKSSSRLHIAHVSTSGSIELIREAKAMGVPITCEVTPHHLLLTHDSVEFHDANTKMNPPLRTAEDIAALKMALKDKVIDCIATDHAPHHHDEKALPYTEAPFGIVGLETALPLMISELVASGLLSLAELILLMSTNPAHILGLPRGEIIIGGLADFTLIDTTLVQTVDPARFYSLGKNTPFAGRTLCGWPVLTMVNGKIVMKDGVVYE